MYPTPPPTETVAVLLSLLSDVAVTMNYVVRETTAASIITTAILEYLA